MKQRFFNDFRANRHEMKSREPRQKVVTRAQMRGDTAWSNVCIRNVSSHGMMLQMTRPPAPGSYVELRRANIVVVGRVMWAEDGSCGLRTQSTIDVGALSSGSAVPSQPTLPLQGAARQSCRPADRLAFMTQKSVQAGRSMQFVFGAVFGAALVSLLSLTAYKALSHPLSVIQRVLD